MIVLEVELFGARPGDPEPQVEEGGSLIVVKLI